MASKKTEKIVVNMINDLINMTSSTDVVEKYGHKWAFKMITAEEYLEVLKACNETEGNLARYFNVALAVLKVVVVEIDDIAVDYDDKELLFNNVAPSFINTLFSEFEEIRNKKEIELEKLDKKSKIVSQGE